MTTYTIRQSFEYYEYYEIEAESEEEALRLYQAGEAGEPYHAEAQRELGEPCIEEE